MATIALLSRVPHCCCTSRTGKPAKGRRSERLSSRFPTESHRFAAAPRDVGGGNERVGKVGASAISRERESDEIRIFRQHTNHAQEGVDGTGNLLARELVHGLQHPDRLDENDPVDERRIVSRTVAANEFVCGRAVCGVVAGQETNKNVGVEPNQWSLRAAEQCSPRRLSRRFSRLSRAQYQLVVRG
jgi:hypothetical protein